MKSEPPVSAHAATDAVLGSVLVVDDDASVRHSLRTILEPSYIVFEAERGAQALRLLARNRIDVILLDLKMPGLDGIATLKGVRLAAPEVEVVIITGYASYDAVIEGLRLHAFDYVLKPFDTEHLLRVVRRATGSRPARPREAVVDAEAAEMAAPLAELVSEIERLAKRAEWSLDRAARLKLDYIVLLANSLHERMGRGPQSLLPDLIDELDNLADRYETADGPELRRARCLAREVEQRLGSRN